MSLDPHIRDQAYHFFVAEAPELLQNIESGILTLRKEYSTAKVHSIMRAAHSIKGGAAGVGLEGIKAIAHRLEDIFKALYHAEDQITPDFERKLLQAYDCLHQPLSEQIATGNYDAEQAVAEAEAILTEIESDLGEAMTQGDDFIPSSEDLGVDMVSSIFQVDVQEGLERLQNVIANPEQYEVAGEVRAEAEVFTGLAEITGLTGFGEIAQRAIEALDACPQQGLEIARIFIRDVEAGRNAFLNGDRKRGGEPSPELLAYTTPDASASADEGFAETEDSAIAASVDDLFGEDETDSPEALVSADDLFAETGENAIAASADDLFGEDETDSPETLVSADDLLAETEDSAIAASADDLFGEDETDPKEALASTDEESETEATPESLAEAMTTLKQNFEELPLADDLPTPANEQPAEQPTPVSAPASPAAGSKPSIRVEVERLQTMDNQLGELVIQRNSLAVQNEQLQRGLRELLNRFSRFKNLVGRLEEFSDKEIISQSNQRPASLQPTTGNENGTAALNLTGQPESVLDLDFDSLELDQYGALNAVLQELLEETAQIEESVGDVSLFTQQSEQTLLGQRKMLEQLRDELIWARMLPLSNILDRFPRILRDFSHQYNKPTRLQLEGTGVRVDKSVLERLYDPLTHLIRNAFDHGIEATETRQKAGKPEEGEIAIRAYYQGNQTVIEVSDDGSGINLERVKAKALNTGLLTEEQLARASSERLYNLLFESGFSTAVQVSDLSGRGVGLDVVREQIRELKGTISLRSQPGKGTTFTLNLPTTQSMAKLLIGLVETTIWALPSDNIEQILVPSDHQVKQTGKQRFLWWYDQALPIYHLSDLLEYNCPVPAASPDLKALGAIARPQERACPLLILRRGDQLFPLELDRVITEQELVIKPFGSAIATPDYVSGCTILGDGNIVPVLDSFALLEDVQQTPKSSVIRTSEMQGVASQTPTLLIVDDSATQRQTLTLTFQRAGYQVLQAGDGREAISVLQRQPQTKAVICDIEMPNLNGFEFLRYRRQDDTLKQIPVVMLTSRSSDKHRKLCEHLGADNYFTKPYLEKEFISAIESLL